MTDVDPEPLQPARRRHGAPGCRGVRAPAETLAFWAAVLLPFCYIPLLYTGVGGTDGLVALAALLAANVVALFVGHDHNREGG